MAIDFFLWALIMICLLQMNEKKTNKKHIELSLVAEQNNLTLHQQHNWDKQISLLSLFTFVYISEKTAVSKWFVGHLGLENMREWQKDLANLSNLTCSA